MCTNKVIFFFKFKKLTRSRDCFCFYVKCVFVCQLRASFTSFGQLLGCAHKRIVNIMKVYIETFTNNMQVELI